MAKVLSRNRILIVDDHSMIREGLRWRNSAFSDLEVCGEATTEDEAIAKVGVMGKPMQTPGLDDVIIRTTNPLNHTDSCLRGETAASESGSTS